MPRTCKTRQRVWSDYYDGWIKRCKKWRCDPDPQPRRKARPKKKSGGRKGRR